MTTSHFLVYLSNYIQVQVMPKATFHKLKSAKKEAIVEAFLYEFSHYTYEEASITSVVKTLGISKGSIYQYFDSKLDLLLYLKEQCEQTKMQYIMHLRRSDYPDFWTYYRDLYEQGIKFDIENPLHSRLLYNISISKHSPALQQVFATWKLKALKMFESMIIQEIESGEFRRDVSVKTMAHFLYSISSGIGEYMKDIHSVDFEENLKVDKPLLDGKTKVLLKSIDESILLLQSAFNKKTP